MRRVLIILLLITKANLEMQSVQYGLHMARNTRSNSLPVQTGYVYSQYNNGPPKISSIENIGTNAKDILSENLIKIDDKLEKFNYKDDIENTFINNIDPSKTHLTEYEKSKSKLWKGKSSKIPSLEEASANEIVRSYDRDNGFQVDEEDVRTDRRNSYDDWPYFYQSSYDYEPFKFNLEYEKAKDKRYSMDSIDKVIPVHEDIKEVYPHSEIHTPSNLKYDQSKVTDNPIFADKPFFSFVLNDYFDKTDEEDPLVFKGDLLSWASDFDHEMAVKNIDYANRLRRLENSNLFNSPGANYAYGSDHNTQAELEKAKSFHNSLDNKNFEKSNELENNIDQQSKHDSEKYKGFKEFVDSFANKFGSEENNKNSKYLLKMDADKGEKKKGFRRVYHKDEYQEDNEFYDNKKKKAASDEKGGSNLHTGGSEAFLGSKATALRSDEHDAKSSSRDHKDHQLKKNNDASKSLNQLNNEINRFRDVAKHAAMSNNADYIDHFL